MIGSLLVIPELSDSTLVVVVDPRSAWQEQLEGQSGPLPTAGQPTSAPPSELVPGDVAQHGHLVPGRVVHSRSSIHDIAEASSLMP